QAEGRGKTVVFTRTKRAAAKLVEELNDRGFNAAAVHGDLNQEQRERAMAAFKAGKKDILIATDVAARGIDVNDVTHVINHTIPDDHDTYLHRAGRTGRAGKTGIAVTFVDWDDMHKWSLINRALDMGQPEPVETYSSSPHLYTDLDIPADAKGRLQSAGPAREREPRSATASASAHSGGRGGGRDGGARDGSARQGGSRDGGARDGAARDGSGHQGGGSPRGEGRERTRTRGGSGDAPRTEAAPRAEGAGTHDGSGPTRRRRNRTRRPSTGSTPPPVA
ncbi:MAG: hypothetical protein QOJ18_1216, partial [Microbacteriaceae bacterium]|nr:hypothetical protein [Microbacteriaceae bacterium]